MNTRSLFDADDPAPARTGKGAELPACYREPVRRGASVVERAEVLANLERDAADYVAGRLDTDSFYRAVRGSLYVLTAQECVRVAKGLILLLGG